MIRFGRQLCGDLAAASAREWLAADGLGGYAMGTVSGLRTRRYHGLQVVATEPPIGRRLGLVALDPALVIGSRRHRLAVHEWKGGAVDPTGYLDLELFELEDGVPRWRWAIGDVILERELAMVHGRPAVGVVHRLVRAPGPLRLELTALCTWRDVHGERLGGQAPEVELTADGFVFEEGYRVAGPGFRAGGGWYLGVRHRVEAERGLSDHEDVWFAGTFSVQLRPNQSCGVVAWAGDLATPPPPAETIVTASRQRARQVVERSGLQDGIDQTLVLAADQVVVTGPAVVAGYPWFGEWFRDTMTSYEGLLLSTRRWEEGRALLARAATTLSQGMLANTADYRGPEYNTSDATLWFLHAIGRHLAVTGDEDLGAELAPALQEVIRHHLAGTRFGIGVDPADGLLQQGQPGYALTWMDARIDGVPVAPRIGKPVEINALWINGLAVVGGLFEDMGIDSSQVRALETQARTSFQARFPTGHRIFDVVDGPDGDDASLRPNGLLAVSLPHGPLQDRRLVETAGHALLTSLGLRSLAPTDPRYRGRHAGGVIERDRAYQQGTVWPWLMGSYVEAALKVGLSVAGVLEGLESHLSEYGLGSVSETAWGDAPHPATGSPFQAWSVAELLRARRFPQ